MICLRWWELILALFVGEWLSGILGVEKRGQQAARWLAGKIGAHRDGSEGVT